jgi:hypothetical protein
LLEFLHGSLSSSWLHFLVVFFLGVVVGYFFARVAHQYYVWETWNGWFQSLALSFVSWQQPGLVYPSAWQAFPVTALIGALASRRQRAIGGG